MEPCNIYIYNHGTVHGVYDKSKEDAEDFCNNLNDSDPDNVYDWHYVGGRAVVKTLPRVLFNQYKINGTIKLPKRVKALKDLPYIVAGDELEVKMYIIGEVGEPYRVGLRTKCGRIEQYDLTYFEGVEDV